MGEAMHGHTERSASAFGHAIWRGFGAAESRRAITLRPCRSAGSDRRAA